MTHLCSDTHLLALLFLLWDDLLSFFSFITCHPLHFAYLLFFSPYLLQIISFLYPLLLSTSLLLLALLTVSPHLNHPPPTLFGNTCHAVLDLLKARLDGDPTLLPFEPLGYILSQLQACMEAVPIDETTRMNSRGEEQEVSVVQAFPIDGFFGWELETIGKLCKALASYEAAGDYPIKFALANLEKNGLSASDFGQAGEAHLSDENLSKTPPKTREIPEMDPDGSEFGSPCLVPGSPISPVGAKGLDRFGSARKEKEWKRTLACKLYEEEKVVGGGGGGGGEGMDLLWEDYEADGGKENKAAVAAASTATKNKKDKKGKKKAKKYEPEEEGEEEEEEEMTGHFCCLQALSFSTRKMNLGMGRPNLMKISKAFKGMGLFHHAGRRSRKG